MYIYMYIHAYVCMLGFVKLCWTDVCRLGVRSFEDTNITLSSETDPRWNTQVNRGKVIDIEH